MLRIVIEKELKDCIYGYRSLLVFVLAVTLFILAIVTGARKYQSDLREYRLAQARLHDQLSEKTTLWAFSTAGLELTKHPPVLEILVNGIEPFTPQLYYLNVFYPPAPRGSTTSENPIGAVYGSLDILFIVLVVLSLAALAFTFSTICGEKETGTLKLQLANPLPKDILILGKLLGNLLGLLVPVALSLLFAFLLLAAMPEVTLQTGDLARIALLGLDFFLFITVMFSLGICISTLTTRTTTAFGICLVAWVFLVAIIPKVALMAATTIAPGESLEAFEMRKTEVDRHGSADLDEMIQRYMEAHPGKAVPHEAYDDMLKKVRQQQNEEFTRLEEEYLQRKQDQARWAEVLARFSPAGSVSAAAMALAQTGLGRDIRFRTALRNYHADFVAYYDRKTDAMNAQAKDDPKGANLAEKQAFEDVPPFEFHGELLSVSVSHALPDMGLLVLWAIVFFAIAYFRFLSYDVR